MKKLVKVFIIYLLFMLFLVGCNNKADISQNDNTKQNELIVCYSQTGTTKIVAEFIQKNIGGDIFQLEIENSYSNDVYETLDHA